MAPAAAVGAILLAVILVAVQRAPTASGFVTVARAPAVPGGRVRMMAGSQGFGEKPAPERPPKKGRGGAAPQKLSGKEAMIAAQITGKKVEGVDPTEEEPVPKVQVESASEQVARLEAERALRKEREEQRIRDILEAERVTAEDPNAGVIPEVVANRMLMRVVPFFSLPVLAGLGVFGYFFVAAKKYEISYNPALVAFSTQAPFILALVGISYGILSASWDPETEGSALGFDEFKTNLGNILEGLRRSSDAADIKDAVRAREKQERAQQGMNRAQRRQQGSSDDGDV